MIQHVNVVVPPGATDRVAAFYVDVLGLTRVPKDPAAGEPARGAWLDVAAGQQVHLSERDGAAHPDAHFALVVDDLEAVRRRVAAAGAPWQDAASVGGARRAFTRDPAGNRIELVAG